jgi:hypothetical protein
MNSIDYIKESLNTLRIEFMAQVLMIIAIGSGLSKMYLSGANFSTDYLYSVGIIVFNLLGLNLLFTIVKLR